MMSAKSVNPFDNAEFPAGAAFSQHTPADGTGNMGAAPFGVSVPAPEFSSIALDLADIDVAATPVDLRAAHEKLAPGVASYEVDASDVTPPPGANSGAHLRCSTALWPQGPLQLHKK